MNIQETKFKDLFIIQPKIISDERGYFVESYKADFFNKLFPAINFCQENESMSSYGILRGLHYQLPPFAQTKLVRVIKGKVLDVVVDIRRNSTTFGQSFSIELSGENKKQLLIPRGFAHGFIVLSKSAIFSYKVDNNYSKEHERGIKFDDYFLKIDWKLKKDIIKLSKKDLSHPSFNEVEYFNL